MMFGLPVGMVSLVLIMVCANLATVTLWRASVSELKAYKQEVQTKQAKAEAEHSKRLLAAANTNDRLTATVFAHERQIAQLSKEKSDAIQKLTMGRKCFDDRAVRLLNQPYPTSKPELPQTSPDPVSENGTFATDTDVGQWIVHAVEQYEQCRSRIDAIATFYESNP